MATKAELEHLRQLYQERGHQLWQGSDRSKITVYDEPMTTYREVPGPNFAEQTVQKVVFERLPLYYGGRWLGYVITTDDGYFITIEL